MTTVASLMFASNKSCCTNLTRSPTPAFLRLSFASRMRTQSISMPTPRAPYSFAAVIGIRPSPDPRSYTTSAGVTFARFSIATTTLWGVGTNFTSGGLSRAICALDGVASTAAEPVATTGVPKHAVNTSSRLRTSFLSARR